MSDYYVRIYLYLLIFLNLFFILLHVLMWLVRRRPLFKPKMIWRDVLFIIIGAAALWLFNAGVLSGSAVLLVTGALLIGSVYALELIDKKRSRGVRVTAPHNN